MASSLPSERLSRNRVVLKEVWAASPSASGQEELTQGLLPYPLSPQGNDGLEENEGLLLEPRRVDGFILDENLEPSEGEDSCRPRPVWNVERRCLGKESTAPDEIPGVLHLYPRFQRYAAQTGHKGGYEAVVGSHVPPLPSYPEGATDGIERIRRPFIEGHGGLGYQAGILKYATRGSRQAPIGGYMFPCLVPPACGGEYHGGTAVARCRHKKTTIIRRKAQKLLGVRNSAARITCPEMIEGGNLVVAKADQRASTSEHRLQVREKLGGLREIAPIERPVTSFEQKHRRPYGNAALGRHLETFFDEGQRRLIKRSHLVERHGFGETPQYRLQRVSRDFAISSISTTTIAKRPWSPRHMEQPDRIVHI